MDKDKQEFMHFMSHVLANIELKKAEWQNQIVKIAIAEIDDEISAVKKNIKTRDSFFRVLSLKDARRRIERIKV